MSDFPSLKNHLLIAMPQLADPNFYRSVTLICEHNADGAMGIVINHPLQISTPELLQHMEIPCDRTHNHNPVLAGGPVQVDRGFVIHRADQLWASTMQLNDKVAITTSPDVLHAIGDDKLDPKTFIALGYAGWGPGQLEKEILENSWLTVPMDEEILFEADIDKRWELAAQKLGVDVSQLTGYAGHA